MDSPSSFYSQEDITSSIRSASDVLQLTNVKEHQQTALTHLLNGHDVFVNLPTGYGKSMIFHSAPLCKDFLNRKLKPSTPRSLAIVISPVTALIEDQIHHLKGLGVPALHLHEAREKSWGDNVKKVKNGEFSLLFASPEVLFSSHGKDLLASKEVRDNICGIFIDECHCIAKWGHSGSKTKAFREDYGKLAELRAFVPSRVPLVALTATATVSVKRAVIESLNMLNYHQITESPNRPNIKLMVTHIPQRKPYNDTIMYCRTRVQCHSLYAIFDEHVDNSELFAMYHGSTVTEVQKKVVEDFENPEGKIRLLFATIAFGMGVDVKGVHTVLHLGVPQDVDDYVQESGRAGRDGMPSFSVVITYPAMYSATKTEKRMKNFVRNRTECRRKLVLREFNASIDDDGGGVPQHSCCDVCASKCECGDDEHFTKAESDIMANFDDQTLQPDAFNRRYVSREAKALLEERLFAYRQSLLHTESSSRFLAGEDLATGIPTHS